MIAEPTAIIRNMKARQAARLSGLKFYCTGSRCAHGHLSEKYASTGGCVECVRLRQADWQKKNKEKRHQSYLRYKEKHLEETRERSRAWYHQNSDKENAKKKEKRAALHDLIVVLRVEMPELLKEIGLS